MSDINQLLAEYAEGAEEQKAVFGRIAEPDWDAVPVEGMWTCRQVLCHLADAEIIYAERMKRVIAEDNPTLFDADPNVFVPALHCPSRDVEQEMNVIIAVRAHMLTILNCCEIEDFQRTGVHSADGPMTLETLLERITQHIPHHLHFVHQKLQALQADV